MWKSANVRVSACFRVCSSECLHGIIHWNVRVYGIIHKNVRGQDQMHAYFPSPKFLFNDEFYFSIRLPPFSVEADAGRAGRIKDAHRPDDASFLVDAAFAFTSACVKHRSLRLGI